MAARSRPDDPVVGRTAANGHSWLPCLYELWGITLKPLPTTYVEAED
jgi:hypothetical protein